MSAVHPSLRSYAELLGAGMDLSTAGIAAANALIGEVTARPRRLADPAWSVRTTTAESGGHVVEAVVATPVGVDVGRVLVWVHGGGFVTGRPEQDLDLLNQMCVPTRTAAVAVRYRLAPAADLDDMVADVRTALRWAGSRWPAACLVLGGESAGGALAVLAVLDGAAGCVAADALVLLCPMLDDATADPDHDEWVWSAANSRDAWSLAGIDHTRSRPPARHAFLRGLPPTHLEYGELDVLAPETARFAARLRSCDVQLVEHCTPGAVHGFVHAGDGPLVGATLQRLRRTLCTATRRPRPSVRRAPAGLVGWDGGSR